MKLKFGARHIAGIAVGIIILIVNILVLGTDGTFFKPILALSVAAFVFPFWIDMLKENARQKEIEEKFLEFVRAITGNVKSGTPIPKAIREAAESNYGALTPYIQKLSHQMEWGIPFREALVRFAKSTENNVIRRSVAIIIEAEQSGGNIQDVMEGVAISVVQIKKIKDERRANSFAQLIQGYIVFFIFIGIMVVLQVFLLPQLSDVSGDVFAGLSSGGDISQLELGEEETTPVSINFETLFIFLILIQGFFAGIMIGDFSEGKLKYGIKHSFIFMLIGYMVFTIATGLLG
jgi:flagellar protein FlaJ